MNSPSRRSVLKWLAASAPAAWLFGSSAACSSEDSPATRPSAEGDMARVRVKVIDANGQLVGPVDSPRVVKSDAEWKKLLTPEQYKIARNKGTEAAFCGTLLDNKLEGIYACICCGLPLFSSANKFESGTGWPSFFQPVAKENVIEHADNSYGMQRTEILCPRCDCHLGHVFEDGPRPTGLRFCVNSDSLRFVESSKIATLADAVVGGASQSPATQPSGR